MVNKAYQSPNFGDRVGGEPLSMIVLHYTATPSTQFAIDLLCDPTREISAHYVVSETGEVFQLVDEAKRAWHAGVSSWEGITDSNSRSIGIEIQNIGMCDGAYVAFEEAQMISVMELCRTILTRHPIRPYHVLGHSDIALGRKIDPGPKFPWHQFYEAGIGLYVPELANKISKPTASLMDQGAPIKAFQKNLYDYGYGIEVTGQFDAETHIVVQAFQAHFRPADISGKWDDVCGDILEKLLERKQKFQRDVGVV